jgi:hypothetical protein
LGMSDIASFLAIAAVAASVNAAAIKSFFI